MLIFIIIAIVSVLINTIILKFGFNELYYSMHIKKRFVEIDDEIPITILVENKKWLAIPFITIHELFPEGFKEKINTHSLFILPKQRVERTYKTSCQTRGKKIINEVNLELGDFFGFKSQKARYKIDEHVVVKPKSLDLTESLTYVGALSGEIPVKRHLIDDPLMTIGIREYTGSEPQRFIHWPSSVRYGELMVKQFDFTSENNVMVLTNCEAAKPSWEPIEVALIERVISYSRGVVEALEEHQIPYGLATNAKDKRNIVEDLSEIRTAMGRAHLEAIVEKLSVLEYRLVNFFENTLRNITDLKGRYKTIVIVTPRLLESYIEPLNGLNKVASKVIVIALEDTHFKDLDPRIITYKERL